MLLQVMKFSLLSPIAAQDPAASVARSSEDKLVRPCGDLNDLGVSCVQLADRIILRNYLTKHDYSRFVS